MVHNVSVVNMYSSQKHMTALRKTVAKVMAENRKTLQPTENSLDAPYLSYIQIVQCLFWRVDLGTPKGSYDLFLTSEPPVGDDSRKHDLNDLI